MCWESFLKTWGKYQCIQCATMCVKNRIFLHVLTCACVISGRIHKTLVTVVVKGHVEKRFTFYSITIDSFWNLNWMLDLDIQKNFLSLPLLVICATVHPFLLVLIHRQILFLQIVPQPQGRGSWESCELHVWVLGLPSQGKDSCGHVEGEVP